eukprot:2780724-Pyramimonas_sp.AAC.1
MSVSETCRRHVHELLPLVPQVLSGMRPCPQVSLEEPLVASPLELELEVLEISVPSGFAEVVPMP